MRMVRLAMFAAIVVVIGGAAYSYRGDIAQRLGFGASASEVAQAGASPAASAQPQGRRGRLNPGGAVPVVVTKVAQKEMPIVIEAVGTVQAIASIQIKPRMDSQIMKVHVAEGALVKEGDLLFELDSRALRAQLGQIEAQIRKDQAQVAQARRDLSRFEDLLAKSAGTVVSRDTAFTTLKAAEAQLDADEAAKAIVMTQLSFMEIRAPVSGRIGSISSKAGTVVRVGDNSTNSVLATINQVDPIYVAFAVPQVFLPEIRAAMANGDVQVNAVVGDKRQSGIIAFLENSVDPLTGTVTAKARIANASEGLWPGQFVKVEIILGVESSAIAVPTAAIQLGAKGPYLFVINDGVAELRSVTVKRAQDGVSVIGKGLEVGEQIAIDGQLRLVDGASVTIRPGAPATPSTASSPPRG